jgi:hypothetical protein
MLAMRTSSFPIGWIGSRRETVLRLGFPARGSEPKLLAERQGDTITCLGSCPSSSIPMRLRPSA